MDLLSKHMQDFRELLCGKKSTSRPEESREVLLAEDSESPPLLMGLGVQSVGITTRRGQASQP